MAIRGIRIRVVWPLAVAAAIGAAHAQPRAPADCHGIASSAERLACYDAVSGRPAGPPPAATAPSSGAPPDAMSRAVAMEAPRPQASLIDSAWGFEPGSNKYDIRFYRSNYLLVGRYTDQVNVGPYIPLFEAAGEPVHLDKTEAKFQLSFKARVWASDDRRWGAWVAYTQQNQWQVYNDEISRPFRETNYEPEIFAAYRPGLDLGGGFRWNLVTAGFNHQSNGRTDTLSRSWNRLFVEGAVERENLVLSARFWYRIPENDADDDNPDITRYLGHGQLGALYRWNGHTFSGAVRGNVSTGKGAFQASWFSPPFLGPFRGYVQVFTGYGESMIDYNWRQTTIGAGVALSDGL
jgi:phospholipase A1/A2